MKGNKIQFLAPLLVAALLSSAAFAKEDAHELLTKSFQQADIWTQGPVKLVAKVRMPSPNGDLTVDYTVSWAGPDKWRAEWSTPGLQQVTILNNGKMSYYTNQPSKLVRALEFEVALMSLDAQGTSRPP